MGDREPAFTVESFSNTSSVDWRLGRIVSWIDCPSMDYVPVRFKNPCIALALQSNKEPCIAKAMKDSNNYSLLKDVEHGTPLSSFTELC